MKVVVDPERCVGNGFCEFVAPEIFAVGDDMITRVRVDDIPGDQHAALANAVASCPARALRITG